MTTQGPFLRTYWQTNQPLTLAKIRVGPSLGLSESGFAGFTMRIKRKKDKYI